MADYGSIPRRFRRVALLCAAVAVVACVAFFSSAHSTEPTELFFLTKKDADIAMEHLKAAGMGAEEPLPDHIKQLQEEATSDKLKQAHFVFDTLPAVSADIAAEVAKAQAEAQIDSPSSHAATVSMSTSS